MKRLAMLLLLTLSAPAGADESLAKVFACMQANVPSHFSIENIELSATDRGGGTRTLTGRLFVMHDKTAGGAARVSLHIDAPPALAGAAYLIRQGSAEGKDEMYVYLPSVKRVRRVTGSLADGSLLGTNFSYVDFKELQTAFAGASAQLRAPEDVDGRPADVLAIAPRPEEQSPYTAIRAWVDRKTCVVIKAEFDDASGTRKRLGAPAGALKESAGYWYLSQVEMHDLRDGTATTLRTLGVDDAAQPSASVFDPRTFDRER